MFVGGGEGLEVAGGGAVKYLNEQLKLNAEVNRQEAGFHQLCVTIWLLSH